MAEQLSHPQLMDIHREFTNTEAGMTLAENVRYERYKPAKVTNERWVKLLGADVNNLTHLTLTYGLTQDYIRSSESLQPGYLNTAEQELLQVAALVHDWAEAVVGDISFGDKTPNDEIAEQAAFEAHATQFYSGGATELISKARTEIVFDHNGKSKLGRVFNAIERVGYLRTALRASDHIIREDAPDCDGGLRWLTADVLSQQPVELIKYSQEFAPVRQYLQKQSGKIAQAFALTAAQGDEVFDNYTSEKREEMRLRFQQSYDAWREWSYLNEPRSNAETRHS